MNKFNLHIFYHKIYYVLLLVFLLFSFSGCVRKQEPVNRTGFFFDTVISITLYEDTAQTNTLLDECMSLCTHYEKLLSRTLEGSDIYRINHANGAPVTVSEETIELLETALFYAQASNGTVDPTIAPLSALWNFSGQAASSSPVVPSAETIHDALQHVDYTQVTIDGTTVTLTDTDAQLDLGFIAKGFIADKLKEYLISQDIKSGIINLGGNVLTIGNKPDGNAYQIGIRKPFDEMGNAMFSLAATDSSVVSSGCYERYFYVDNTLYHHILDTSTGYPVKNNLLSVTILSDSSMEGDALSTLCYALGLDAAQTLIENTPNVEAIFILDDYSIVSTSGAPDISF